MRDRHAEESHGPPAAPRKRAVSSLCIAVVLALGLGSRTDGIPVPEWFVAYGGDTLWALLVYLGIGFLFPNLSVAKTAIAALLFAGGIELSQLYQAPWIDALRPTKLGGLVLGFGFLWADLVCYSLGITFGALTECILRRSRAAPQPR